jgi:hypothetical protein
MGSWLLRRVTAVFVPTTGHLANSAVTAPEHAFKRVTINTENVDDKTAVVKLCNTK